VQYSALTSGNVAFVTGNGFALNGQKIRAKASYGITARPILTEGTYRQFQRNMLAMSFGWGDWEKKAFDFTYIHAKDIVPDDVSKIDSSHSPIDGTVLSLQGRWAMKKVGMYLRSEGAVSVVSKDATASTTLPAWVKSLRISETEWNVITFLIPTNLASIPGLAYDAEIGIKRTQWAFAVQRKSLTGKYQSLAFLNQLNDYTDQIAKIHFSQAGKKQNWQLDIDANGGLRETNVSQTKMTNDRQLILSGDVYLQVGKHFTISGNYNNFESKMSVNTNIDGIQLNRQLVTKSLSISPNISVGKKTKHNLGINLMHDQYDDLGVDSAQVTTAYLTRLDSSQVQSDALGINYRITTKRKTSLSLGVNAFQNASTADTTLQRTASIGIKQSFFKSKWTLNGNLQYSLQQHATRGDDRSIISARLGLNCKLGKLISFNAQGSWRKQVVLNEIEHKTSVIQMLKLGLQFKF
jgi:hypothetical protein